MMKQEREEQKQRVENVYEAPNVKKEGELKDITASFSPPPPP